MKYIYIQYSKNTNFPSWFFILLGYHRVKGKHHILQTLWDLPSSDAFFQQITFPEYTNPSLSKYLETMETKKQMSFGFM